MATPRRCWQVSYADAYQQAALMALKPALQSSANGVFASTCLEHCLSQTTDLFVGVLSDGRNLMQAMTAWWAGERAVLISNCTGYPCVGQQPACPFRGKNISGMSEAIASSTPAEQALPTTGHVEGGDWVQPSAAPPQAAAAVLAQQQWSMGTGTAGGGSVDNTRRGRGSSL